MTDFRNLQRGTRIGLAYAPEHGLALATDEVVAIVATDVGEIQRVVSEIEHACAPRWTLWNQESALRLARLGVRLARSWDVVAVQRLLIGGLDGDVSLVWAELHRLDPEARPQPQPVDLFHPEGDAGISDGLLAAGGYLAAGVADRRWERTADSVGEWARLSLVAAAHQEPRLASAHGVAHGLATAHAESSIELLCAELQVDGLPVDRAIATSIIESFIGPKPLTHADASAARMVRDRAVLQHVPNAGKVDMRSPGQVKSLLRRAGIEVPDTRAGRLRALSGTHPVVDALLAWRKAERVSTTYGYEWLDSHVSEDGRLRGGWTGCDGAAGRMTASVGLHNLPADLRPAVVAESGFVFVRADLGQIEPRVLASISGDADLARASHDDDMYATVATRLGVDRPTAKLAVLGAMYGQTTGDGARALGQLQRTYPTAMAYLDAADRAAQVGNDLRTYGGRRVALGVANANTHSERDLRTHAAARGRFGRNAMVQGAAAELFKVWALVVRARVAELGGTIVLCLHDEILVHVPVEHGDLAAALVDRSLQEAAHRWAPDQSVRFLADTSVIGSWAKAKN